MAVMVAMALVTCVLGVGWVVALLARRMLVTLVSVLVRRVVMRFQRQQHFFGGFKALA